MNLFELHVKLSKNEQKLQTFHNNKHTTVVECVLLVPSLCVKTERSIVKGFDVVDLQRAAFFTQIPNNFGSVPKMVHDVASTIVEDDAPIPFCPDATGHGYMFIVPESARDHNTGASQGAEPERDLSS